MPETVLRYKCEKDSTKKKMNDIFEYDNYVFDLYGTLIDIWTDEHCDETWEKWLAVLDKEGIFHPPVEQFRKEFFDLDHDYRQRPTPFEIPEIDVIDVYADLFWRYRNPPLGEEKLNEISYSFREASTIHKRLFAGVEDFLKKLHELGKKVYILSNAQRSYTLPEILEFGLDKLVDDFLISSDYGCMKPDKAFYSAIVTKHNLDRKRTVMIGDSRENDYEGALNSGLNAIWLNGKTDAKNFYVDCMKQFD